MVIVSRGPRSNSNNMAYEYFYTDFYSLQSKYMYISICFVKNLNENLKPIIGLTPKFTSVRRYKKLCDIKNYIRRMKILFSNIFCFCIEL